MHFVLHTFLRRGRRRRKLQENGKVKSAVRERGKESKKAVGSRENAVENIVQRARSEVDNGYRANNEAFLM